MIRRIVIYTGRVQRVGFRWTTNQLAKGFEVTGFIENRKDGTVYMVAEGNESVVDAFMESISSRMTTNIIDTMQSDGVFTGEFANFSVHY
ncbi:MAG: acylphosphatase [Pirellulales bacterium]|jgi:acylphosphatase|nr:acylphosphatase [Pirellulales bacterium]